MWDPKMFGTKNLLNQKIWEKEILGKKKVFGTKIFWVKFFCLKQAQNLCIGA